MVTDTHTHSLTHRTTTVTLAHAPRVNNGCACNLHNSLLFRNVSVTVRYLISIRSGRMRQVNDSMSGVATIQVLINNIEVVRQENPHPNLRSWQWFGRQLRKPVSNLTVVMTINNLGIPSSSPVMAYFDDLCVTLSDNPPGGGMRL